MPPASEGVVGTQLGLVELPDRIAGLRERRHQPAGACVQRGPDLVGRHQEPVGADPVEALGVLPQGLVASGPHIGHDRLHRGHRTLAPGVGTWQPGGEGGAGAATEVQTVQHVARR